MPTSTTLLDYLVDRLQAEGVEHVFGVPGDFVLDVMSHLAERGLTVVNTCDEQGAGFAADAYARLRGMGAVCVTWGVGGLKVANTTAQAFAERCPVLVLSGAPGEGERRRHPLIHHKVRDFDSQRRVFEELTVASAVLRDPETALTEIDRVFEAMLRFKRPAYLELPRDTAFAKTRRHHFPAPPPEHSHPATLQAALGEVLEKLRAAKQPVILLGEEVHRFELADLMLQFVCQTGIPTAATVLGKSVIDEDEPLYLGVYQGGLGRAEVREYVESADCCLLLGVMMTDMNLGIYTARLDRQRCVHAVAEKLSVGYHVYEDVRFEEFCRGLAEATLPKWDLAPPRRTRPTAPAFSPDRSISAEYLFARLDAWLTEDIVVIADPGDALFGSVDWTVHSSAGYLAPAYYASLGFAVPAALGAQFAAPGLRPLVIVGDGAFQMTGTELSTIARYGLDPIVVVLNNRGYVTERYIRDGTYNDILDWCYAKLPELLGAGRGTVVRTEGELESALADAAAHRGSYFLIEVQLDKLDASAVLKRLASGLRRR